MAMECEALAISASDPSPASRPHKTISNAKTELHLMDMCSTPPLMSPANNFMPPGAIVVLRMLAYLHGILECMKAIET